MNEPLTVDLGVARQLLDFGRRLHDEHRAEEQLQGAVALHNVLQQERVAYLADEVGMGKTYVALGAVALFRHFHPGFRVLFIAPRENIQKKWKKEHENFLKHCVKFVDLRVKGFGDRPARSQVICDRLSTLAAEASANPNRDFFTRMTSFSLPLGDSDVDDERGGWQKLKHELLRALPWLDRSAFAGRGAALKENIARALNAALPTFDLVIVDEAHNFKHGIGRRDTSARNRVLSIALGHPTGRGDDRLFPHYGPRAKRVLFLSATPIDGAWHHLYNQLDVVGRAHGFEALRLSSQPTPAEEEAARTIARRLVIRRTTTVQVGGAPLTKNLYRREWRSGGVGRFDEPIQITDDRQRLVLALMQKKVSELLDADRFQASWQIGMLASFESFAATTRVKDREGHVAVFDDPDQTDDARAREGIDVDVVNEIAGSHRRRFDSELPHPKMDAVVDALARSWIEGRKSLIFVRRVASVKELKRKLDDRYDAWLIDLLQRELPASTHGRLQKLVGIYREARAAARDRNEDHRDASGRRPREQDKGGTDTFFAWFFRGDGPPGVISGATLQKRLTSPSSAWGSFFEQHHVAALLGVDPDGVMAALGKAVGLDEAGVRAALTPRTAKYLGTGRVTRGALFLAAQGAACELLHEQAKDPALREAARLRLQAAFSWHVANHARTGQDPGDVLATRTVFTELIRRPALRTSIWPASTATTAEARLLDELRRASVVSAAARLGHAFIDLYVVAIQALKTLEARAQDDEGSLIDGWLDRLERQMQTPLSERQWGAWDELASIAAHMDLIVDTNLNEVWDRPLSELARELGTNLGEQQPIGGMSGKVNARLVKQFRMPGYPLVLISTDLLQEGEDLHTFCSQVQHYGIGWTPSSMEQRTGRIDRVNSETDRRLRRLTSTASGDDKLQVLFPHLEDTVERLQVDRVLERMDQFLRAMHDGLSPPRAVDPTMNQHEAMLQHRRRRADEDQKPLRSAFPVRRELLRGERTTLAVTPQRAAAARTRFERLRDSLVQACPLPLTWDGTSVDGALLGTARLGGRSQPFVLTLRSLDDRLLVRCVSPIGLVRIDERHDEVDAVIGERRVRLGAIPVGDDDRTYDLTVEDDTLLATDAATDARRVGLCLRRVVEAADAVEMAVLGADAPLSSFAPDLHNEVMPDDI
jgi:hypothetical protein